MSEILTKVADALALEIVRQVEEQHVYDPTFQRADMEAGDHLKAPIYVDADLLVPAMARAAIEAMLEPTDAMWRAAAAENGYVNPEAWRAMITAALNPQP